MPRTARRDIRPKCICEDVPSGTVLNYDVERDYLNHLHMLILANPWKGDLYYCPYTGVVWHSRYAEGRDWRVNDIVYERTRYRQLHIENYTVAKASIQLYHEKKIKKSTAPGSVAGVSLSVMDSEWPDLPIRGLLLEMFSLPENTELTFQYGEIVVEEVVAVELWVYLTASLQRGDSGWCWLASPFEPITSQVLQPGLVLEWHLYGQVGEVCVESQHKVPAIQFSEWFGFDRPYRSLGAELSERFDEMHRNKRRS